MATYHCEFCRIRAQYERAPNSVVGRVWLWHTHWCPGWKAYVNSLSEEERQKLPEEAVRGHH